MNLHQKKVLVIGYNSAIGQLLINKISEQKAYIVIADFDNKINTNNIFPRYSLGQVIDINQLSFASHVSSADIIINLSLCPTPNNLKKGLKKKIKFINTLIKSGQLNNKHVINVLPELNQVVNSYTNKLLKEVINTITSLPISTTIYASNILANHDSILEDISKSIYQYKKLPLKLINKNIFYINNEDLVEIIVKTITSNKTNNIIYAHYKNSILFNNILNSMQNACNYNIKLKTFCNHHIKIINLAGYYKLPSFTKNYLKTFVSSESLKDSQKELQNLRIQLNSYEYIVTKYFANNLYPTVDFRHAMD